MENRQSPEKIRKVAADLDKAVENKDTEKILSSFADDGEIELLGQRLVGKEGVKQWIDWLYKHLDEVKFEPIIIMVEGNTFFEEFIVKARLHNGIEIKSKQAEVLLYENYKIKSLRLYFDRLDFAEVVTRGPVSKAIVNQIIKKSLAGLA
jgi:ketosteroid isomerase-like protein